MWRPLPSLTPTSDLGVQEDQSVEYGTRKCQELAAIVHRLLVDGTYTGHVGEPRLLVKCEAFASCHIHV